MLFSRQFFLGGFLEYRPRRWAAWKGQLSEASEDADTDAGVTVVLGDVEFW